MKKTLLCFFFIVVLFDHAFSQTSFRFADSTAQWNVLSYYESWAYSNTNVFSAIKDTTIHGKDYQKIGPFTLRRDSLNMIYGYIPTTNLQPDTNEYLIFDFSKSVAPSITSVEFLYLGNRQVYIDVIDSVLIGHYRKRMFVRYEMPGPSYRRDVWVDGIGSLYNSFAFPSDQSGIERKFDTTLCFFEHEQLLYHFANYDTCYVGAPYTNIINEGANESSLIIIFPNPIFQSYITVQLSETNLPTSTTFQLFDITGRMVFQKPLSDKVNRVELNEIAKGMYLYNISSLENKIGSDKLVVQ